MVSISIVHFGIFRKRREEVMRIEREMKEAEELARKEAEAEAAALTEILNLDNALVCDKLSSAYIRALVSETKSCYVNMIALLE